MPNPCASSPLLFGRPIESNRARVARRHWWQQVVDQAEEPTQLDKREARRGLCFLRFFFSRRPLLAVRGSQGPANATKQLDQKDFRSYVACLVITPRCCRGTNKNVEIGAAARRGDAAAQVRASRGRQPC